MRKLTRRQTLFAGAVALLLVANLWHWWPRGAEGPRMGSRANETFRAEDFRMWVDPRTEDREEALRRDPFHPKSATPAAKAGALAPPKTSQQLEEEAARAELARIKLVGVVVRNDKPQAFLTNGDQTYMVQPGDKVGSRFRVEEIGTDNIRLRDDKTSVVGRVPISGN